LVADVRGAAERIEKWEKAKKPVIIGVDLAGGAETCVEGYVGKDGVIHITDFYHIIDG